MKSFQFARNANSPATINADEESGITIRKSTVKCPAPSICALSTSESGMPKKNCRTKNIPYTPAMPGMIIDKGEPIQLNLTIMLNMGTRLITLGIIMVVRINVNSRFLPLYFKMLNAYAARLTTSKCKNV